MKQIFNTISILALLLFFSINTNAQMQTCNHHCNGLRIQKTNKRGEGIIGINNNFPTVGDSRLAVILVGFSDLPFTLSNDDFDQLFNQKGYSKDGFIGSVSDYFNDISNGKMNLTIDVAGPYTLKSQRSFYGAPTNGGVDGNVQTMASEAIGLADSDLDFSDYDNDGDGDVDGLYIIFAGNGEEAGGGENAVWSHKSLLNNQISKDGVYLKMYSCSPEYRLNTTKISGIGVICHEFLHACGLPDFYDTDYESSGGQSKGLGEWGIMARGSHTNEGKTPPQISAYEKYALRWLEPVELVGSQSVLLPPLATHNIAYRMSTDIQGEYFLIENRQPIKWDRYLPSHGLLVYHIDKNISNWSSNKVNIAPTKEGYNMLEADNILTEGSYDNDPFPGAAQKNSITNSTTPSLRKNNGAITPHALNNIVEDEVAGNIYFDYLDGDAVSPTNFKAQLLADNTIKLSWDADGDDVLLAGGEAPFCVTPDVSVTAGAALCNDIKVLDMGSSNEFIIENNKAGSRYYFYLWIKHNDTYTGLKTTQITTYGKQPLAETLPFFEDFEDNTIANTWNVYNEGGTAHQVWNNGSFSRGLYIADNQNYAYLNSELYGSVGVQNASLTSPLFDFSNNTKVCIQFDHYYRHINASVASLQYSTDGGYNWNDVETWKASTQNPENYKVDVSSELAGSNNARIRWKYNGSYGYFWCVDNILITQNDIVGIDSENESAIKLYPNPVHNNLIVEGVDDYKLTISDISGKVVLSNHYFDKKTIISLRNFKKGIYFVIVENESVVEIKKIVKLNRE